jgi:hypothetical protein
MQEIKKDASGQEDGEEQLSILIKEAGAEARNRRKRALEDHFEKLNKTIKDAASFDN